MKYLDEQIVEQITGTIAGTSTGIYQYNVLRKNDSANSYTTIFVGNMYHQYGTAFKVDITDIVRNDTWIPTEDVVYSGSNGAAKSINLINTYKVDFIVGGTSYRTDGVQVAKVYRNPHKFDKIGNDPFFDYTISGNVSFPLQGRYSSGGYGYYNLIPRYPYKRTENYRLLLTSESSSNVTSSYLKLDGKLTSPNNTINFNYPSSYTSWRLNTLFTNSTSSTFSGSFGTFHTGQSNDFSIAVNSQGNAVITANEQSDCFFKLVRYDNNRNIVQDYTNGWVYEGEQGVYQITFNDNFYNANNHISGGLAIILAYNTNSNPTTVDNSSGWIEYSFSGLTIASQGILSGKTCNLSINMYQISWMYRWGIDKFNLEVSQPNTNGKILVEAAGDFVAEIDECYSRYYLQWQDRLGGFQSQPFNEHYTYSESIDRETITDYKGVKKVSNINITPRFKVNSNWIKEEYYPFYESIFTSPILFLYDTKLDKRYTVMVTDSEYTEKQYINEKKFFNLTLNLELNKEQNIIY